MNYDVDLESDEAVDDLSFIISDFSNDNTDVEYKEKTYSKTDINLRSTLKDAIIANNLSIISYNSIIKLNSNLILIFNAFNLFTLLDNNISLKNDRVNFNTSFISFILFTLQEEYNSMIFNRVIFSVFYLNCFSYMVRFYYFERN